MLDEAGSASSGRAWLAGAISKALAIFRKCKGNNALLAQLVVVSLVGFALEAFRKSPFGLQLSLGHSFHVSRMLQARKQELGKGETSSLGS